MKQAPSMLPPIGDNVQSRGVPAYETRWYPEDFAAYFVSPAIICVALIQLLILAVS